MSIIKKVLIVVASVGVLAGCATGSYDTSHVRTEVRVSSGYFYPAPNGFVQFYSYTYPNWYTGPYYRSRTFRPQPYYYAPPPQVVPREYDYPRRFVHPSEQPKHRNRRHY